MQRQRRPQFKLIERLRQRRIRHKLRPRTVRGVTIVAGMLLTMIGLLLLALPGPAFAVIPVGLYLLALEFDWAERLLHKALTHAENVRSGTAARGLGRFIKEHPRLTAALIALALTILVVIIAAVLTFDLVPERFRD